MHLSPRLIQFIQYEFSYNLSRKYPFTWFKLVAIIGMPLLFLFFAVLSLATSGYSLQPMSTTDPNSTEAKQYWFNNEFFTWGDDALQPKCERLDLSVGSQLMTTNMGLTYTLKAISNQTKQHSQLSYLNNVLQNCQVKSINVYLRKADFSLPGHSFWWSWGLSFAAAEAECEVTTEGGLFTLHFSVRYETHPKSYDFVIIDDYDTHASIWWGTRLLDNYFNGLLTMMSQFKFAPPGDAQLCTSSQIAYFPGEDGSVRDNKFFKLSYYFLASDGGILNDGNHFREPDQLYNNESELLSRPMTEGLFFAKAFYSLMLVDLGQDHAPNLLLDSDQLQYALDPPDNFNRERGGPLYAADGLDWWKFQGISPPGQPAEESNSVPMRQSYEKFKDQTGPLQTRNASIYSQYTCSIPRRKSKANVILTMLLTGFVFSQTAWTILKFVAEQFVSAADSTAMYCEGCIAQGHRLVDTLPSDHNISSSPPGVIRSIGRSVSMSDSTRGLLQQDHLEDEPRC